MPHYFSETAAPLEVIEKTSRNAGQAHDFKVVRVGKGFRRICQTELGQEQLCARCDEPWPMDPEFFAISGSSVSYECKACTNERRRAR